MRAKKQKHIAAKEGAQSPKKVVFKASEDEAILRVGQEVKFLNKNKAAVSAFTWDVESTTPPNQVNSCFTKGIEGGVYIPAWELWNKWTSYDLRDANQETKKQRESILSGWNGQEPPSQDILLQLSNWWAWECELSERNRQRHVEPFEACQTAALKEGKFGPTFLDAVDHWKVAARSFGQWHEKVIKMWWDLRLEGQYEMAHVFMTNYKTRLLDIERLELAVQNVSFIAKTLGVFERKPEAKDFSNWRRMAVQKELEKSEQSKTAGRDTAQPIASVATSFPTVPDGSMADLQAPAQVADSSSSAASRARKRPGSPPEESALQESLSSRSRAFIDQLLATKEWTRETLANELDVTTSYIGLVINSKTGVAPWFVKALSELAEGTKTTATEKDGASMLRILRKFPHEERARIEELGAKFLKSLLPSGAKSED